MMLAVILIAIAILVALLDRQYASARRVREDREMLEHLREHYFGGKDQ